MNTAQRLMLIYGKTHISLEQAVADWLPHINIDAARRRARKQTLPWPVISSEDTQKTAKLVSLNALAAWIDEREQNAKKEWHKMHS